VGSIPFRRSGKHLQIVKRADEAKVPDSRRDGNKHRRRGGNTRAEEAVPRPVTDP